MSVDYATKFRTRRGALFALLSDLQWHTHLELGEVAGNRYAARALELRRLGYQIESRALETGKVYRLVSLERGQQQEKRVKCFLDEADAAQLVDGWVTDTARAAARDALESFRANRGKL